MYIGYGPLPVTVRTKNNTFLLGIPIDYGPLFATVNGRGSHPMLTCIFPLVTCEPKIVSYTKLRAEQDGFREGPGWRGAGDGMECLILRVAGV